MLAERTRPNRKFALVMSEQVFVETVSSAVFVVDLVAYRRDTKQGHPKVVTTRLESRAFRLLSE